MQRKLASCQCKTGRTCPASQQSSLGSQEHPSLRSCETEDNSSRLGTTVDAAQRTCRENDWNVRNLTNSAYKCPRLSRLLRGETTAIVQKADALMAASLRP